MPQKPAIWSAFSLNGHTKFTDQTAGRNIHILLQDGVTPRGLHVDCCAGPSPALYLRRSCTAIADSRPDRDLPDTHRYFSEHRHSSGQHSVELLWLECTGNVEPDRDSDRTHADHYRRRHRA